MDLIVEVSRSQLPVKKKRTALGKNPVEVFHSGGSSWLIRSTTSAHRGSAVDSLARQSPAEATFIGAAPLASVRNNKISSPVGGAAAGTDHAELSLAKGAGGIQPVQEL